ncbi:purine-nucleoside phosphorylase [Clostridiaceae bacterium NSJ-31]|uniref:Purine nucleoside phosphorylase n=1 Tax=Ligaoa zhengdingensis TaxID=2763658 RepID=A0A926DW91_9FIRM|nr:purine-nucleoside phosphorylase [Ligaoa zhengdingensis]
MKGADCLQNFTYDFYKQSADYLLARIPEPPEIALVLGSGLGPLAGELENPIVIDYRDIPNFLASTVESHAGKLIFGRLSGKRVVCMAGRFHYYEGYEFEQLAAPVRVLRLLGAHTVILTNAAGAVNTAYRVGDIMVIRDQIKLMGASPMRGANLPEFGERFFDVTRMYTPELRALALDCAKRLGQEYRMQEGVYFYMPGPQFETPAEIRAIRLLGGDAVGMSTVTEALTAAHCGMRVLGLSLMTNMAAGVLPQPLSDAEVTEAAAGAAGRFQALLREIIQQM